MVDGESLALPRISKVLQVPYVFGAISGGASSPCAANSYVWLARNEKMDSYSSPCITHYSSFHILLHAFIAS